MIKALTIKQGLLKDILGTKTFVFGSDINIVVGRNGTGKSLIGKTLEYYYPSKVFTPTSVKSFESLEEYYSNWHSEVEIEHLGNVVYRKDNVDFMDKTKAFYEAQSSVEGSSFNEVLSRLKSNKSSGESMKKEVEGLIKLSTDLNKKRKSIISKMSSTNEVHARYYEAWLNIYMDSDHREKPTLILDEYDSGLDLENQFQFFSEILPKLSEKFQVICISHSVLAYFCPYNIIALDDSFEEYREFFTSK